MSDSDNSAQGVDADLIEFLRRAIETMDFGAVEITIHNGAVVQVERKEKVRFSPPKTGTRTAGGNRS
ncbi:YezD family protein [Salinisphaera sp.]|uniref:YezD family protein n=1 Tax=Salinisphaera sp. TaxID=1914330 RepID=UPI002D79FFF3|nr:YezD family protein [Salinisphaera sp.]HET7314394.1 YezD family protein [Salinisphaera sp.]